MQCDTDLKRITFRHTKPNPLFQEWLESLHEEAKEKNSKLTAMLQEALDSISKYPLPLNTGAECAVLKGFNKKLCKFLDMRLEVYNNNLQLKQLTGNGQSNIYTSNFSDGNNASDISDKSRKRPASANSLSNSEKTAASSQSNSTASQYDDYNSDPINTKLIKLSQTSSTNADTQSTCSSNNTDTNSEASEKVDNRKIYKPTYRSGGYAILLALLKYYLKYPDEPSLTKDRLIEIAQKYSEESFVRAKPESFYTAWSNMTKLISKGLVAKHKNGKAEYSLTPEGLALAKDILKEHENRPSNNDIIFNDGHCSSTEETDTRIDDNRQLFGKLHATNVTDECQLSAGTFDIILLIDKNETGGVSKKNDPTVAQFKKYPDLKHEYRSLNIGDFAWIARHKDNCETELVLPYIVERKRMDDLGASIKDGRFHEQKFRLRKCGLSNVIYLVENYGGNKHVGLPLQTLMQALANTRVQDGFKVHMTDSLTDSARFLAIMTKRLTIEYKDKNLKGSSQEPNGDQLMTYNYFNKSSAKTKALTVTEAFIKMLLQLKGMSVDKALAITDKYSTPRSLIKAYEECQDKDAPFLLANLKFGNSRNVGPVVSKSIFLMFLRPGQCPTKTSL